MDDWVCAKHGYKNCSRCERPHPFPPMESVEALSPTGHTLGTAAAPAGCSTAEGIGRAVLGALERHRDGLRARGAALEGEIEALISGDCGPEWGRAARVLQRLTGGAKPSLRTVQWHLQRITQRRQRGANAREEA